MKIINFKKGEIIRYKDQDFAFDSAIDTQKVVAFHLLKGNREVIEISEIRSLEPGSESAELSSLKPGEWEIAVDRFNTIKPLLSRGREKALYRKISQEKGVHVATLYQWLGRFLKTGKVISLLPSQRGPKIGKVRLENEVEEIIQESIQSLYLTNQRFSMIRVYEAIVLKCREKGIKPPHINTVRNRIRSIPEYKKSKCRDGWRYAEQNFTENKNSISADFPLSAVQIDHTLLDIILVDDSSRMPVGRPWITLAFDVYSRIVLGFYISFDPPGTLSTGLCITRSCLPKDKWLMQLGVNANWPCWGLPVTIHADNAKEFRGKMLKMACKNYGIELEWRPVAQPHWGGHIERYMKVLADHLKSLPGATFSNPDERGDYDSDKKSALTISELERYLTIFICNNYHAKIHSGTGKTPLAAWNEAIIGTIEITGIGLPQLVTDEESFRMDFLPFEERTINEYGVRLEGIHYFADVLRPFINSRIPGKYGIRRKFIFRRDPRDISIIYFWDEDNKAYHPIPYRNTALPPISLWELKAAQRHLKEKSLANYDESTVFSAIRELRSLVETSVKETRKKRRTNQRKTMHSEVHLKKKDEISKLKESSSDDLSKFKPFDEIEVS